MTIPRGLVMMSHLPRPCVKTKTTKKKYYFECERGPRGQGVLRQTRLLFSKTPALPSRTDEGHDRVEGNSSNIQFSSTTVGQHGRGATQTAAQCSVGEEKCTDRL